MATLFQRVRKTSKHSNVVIDNGVFTLHYGVTAFILVVLSILVLCNRSDEPISCFPQKFIPSKFLNAFCQLKASSADNVWEQQNGGSAFRLDYEKDSAKRNTSYFQMDDEWLSILLLFEAILFIAPRYFWKYMESGRIEVMVTMLYSKESSREENIRQLSDIVMSSAKRNRKYLLSYLAAELLNALNVSLCVLTLGLFFDRANMSDVHVIEFADNDWSPCWKKYCDMSAKLPKLIECTVNRYTYSEGMVSQQALMILPTDIIHLKIYTFLLYWFCIVACLSYLVLGYRVFLIISPALRVKVLRLRCKNVNPSDLVLIIRALGIENWFLINLLSKNVDPEAFSDSTAILANKIRNGINISDSDPDAAVY